MEGLMGVLNIQIQPKRAGKGAKSKAEVGLQPYKVVHPQTIGSTADVSETLFFAVSSTSGRVVRYQVRPIPFPRPTIMTRDVRKMTKSNNSKTFSVSCFKLRTKHSMPQR